VITPADDGLVSAEGIEFTLEREFNNMQVSGCVHLATSCPK